jgi:glycosyltransferase involved in cell wall biosynthesis
LAAVEAAQAGIPTIATDLPVLREVLRVDGSPCALFVDTSDEKAFTAAVHRLLEDEKLRVDMISRGKRLKYKYSADGMVHQYCGLIRSVTAVTK